MEVVGIWKIFVLGGMTWAGKRVIVLLQCIDESFIRSNL